MKIEALPANKKDIERWQEMANKLPKEELVECYVIERSKKELYYHDYLKEYSKNRELKDKLDKIINELMEIKEE